MNYNICGATHITADLRKVTNEGPGLEPNLKAPNSGIYTGRLRNNSERSERLAKEKNKDSDTKPTRKGKHAKNSAKTIKSPIQTNTINRYLSQPDLTVCVAKDDSLVTNDDLQLHETTSKDKCRLGVNKTPCHEVAIATISKKVSNCGGSDAPKGDQRNEDYLNTRDSSDTHHLMAATEDTMETMAISGITPETMKKEVAAIKVMEEKL